MKQCLECNNNFKESDYRAKFCSRSCSGLFNNKNRKLTGWKMPEISKIKIRRSIAEKYNKEIKTCTKCNCEYIIKKNSKVNLWGFCSNECSLEFKKDKRHFDINLGKVKNRQSLKRFLTETVGYKCVWCHNVGFHRNAPLVLHLDHIDGNEDNNIPANIRLLCPNCHSQTETYSGKDCKTKYKGTWRSIKRSKKIK